MNDARTTQVVTHTLGFPPTAGGIPPRESPGGDPASASNGLDAETQRLVDLGWEEITDLRGFGADRPASGPHRKHRHTVGAEDVTVAPALHPVRTALAERLPAGLRGGRLALSRGAVTVLVVVALLACGTAAAFLWRSQPHTVELGTAAATGATEDAAWVPPSPQSSGGRPSAPGDPDPPPEGRAGPKSLSPPSQLVVDVEGRVAHPGVERLPSGTRVVDAVAAAGGALPGTDTSAINLARLLADGDEIIVGPSGGVLGGAARAAAGPGGGPEVPLDLNAATAEQLQTLPGVGPSLAQRIIDWRTQHGPFTDVSQLRRVKGIGSGTRYAELAKRVRV